MMGENVLLDQAQSCSRTVPQRRLSAEDCDAAVTMGVWKLVAAVVLVTVAVAAADGSSIWPKPTTEHLAGPAMQVNAGTFQFAASGPGGGSAILSRAFSRYANITFRLGVGGRQVAGAAVSGLAVVVSTDNETLALGTDESYKLTVQTPTAQLTASTVFGALRGLETFAQLVKPQADGGYAINMTTISDSPRFQHRGVMIDTARHWYPLTVIYSHLDAMAYAKMSVLHWHLVDDQSFPYESAAFPQLSAKGAWTSTHVYSKSDIESVIAYARDRGIRVVAEFDTPGHTRAWGYGQAGLLTQCYDDSGKPVPDSFGPINPTVNSTFDFLRTLFTEIVDVWPDAYVHVGGDEVSFDCWESNPSIQAWMKQRGWTDFAQLENYYEDQLLAILESLNHGYICWEELFTNGLKLRPDTVVNVWKGGDWNQTISAVTKAGYRSVLSAPWYLNYISYGEDWNKYYAIDPLDFDATPEQKKLVAGGEACLWSEYIDATNFISRAWPRAGAVAERLWSPADVTDITDATARMHDFRCRLLTLGINAEPPTGPSFCDHEFFPTYLPPWGQQ